MTGRLTQSLLCACLASMLLPSAAGAAEQELPSITVTSSATVTAKPDVVEIVGTVSGQGQLAGDAVTKFRGARQAAIEALKGLSIAGLQIEARGFSVGTAVPADRRTQILLRGQPGQAEEGPMVAVQETLKICIQGIDKLDADALLSTIVKVVDAGQEAGIAFSRPLSDVERFSSRGTSLSFTTFTLKDKEQRRQRASELAMERARADARRMAALAGAQLGDVESVREAMEYLPTSLRSSAEDTSPTSSEIQQTVTLNVRFKLKR